MKTKGIILAVIAATAVGVGNGLGATNEVSGLLQKGLFEEEANRNLDAAILAYRAVVAQTDKDRQFGATAIFRLGECYRKQGKTNEANAEYQRILREFPDQKELATLSRQQLGNAGGQNNANPNQNATVSAEQIVEIKKLSPEKRRVAVQQMFPNPVLDSLMQKMTETEQAVAVAKSNFGKDHPEVTSREALLKTIIGQVDDQVEAALSRQESLVNGSMQSSGETAGTMKKKTPEEYEAEFIKRIQAIIKDSPDLINAADQAFGYKTPLQSAVESRQPKAVKFLLDNKADIEARDQFGRTALLNAAKFGDKDMVELLAGRGADVNATSPRGDEGFGALHFAADHGYKAVADVLLDHGAKVDLRAWNEVTPLMVAARKGYKTVVETLLAKGANIDVKDSNGKTALVAAVNAGNKTIAEWLLAKKADVNARDSRGKTALFTAVISGNKSLAEWLLANAADVNAADVDGKSALFTAVDKANDSMVEMLLTNKADVNLKTPDGLTPLMASVIGKHFEITKMLVDHGADLASRMSDNNSSYPRWTPLVMAVAMNDGDTVKLLLEHQANPNEVYDEANGGVARVRNETVLSLAASRKFLETAKLLLQHGADVNMKSANRSTALVAAYGNNNREMASLLLDNKADVQIKYSEGRTVLHFAAIDGKQDFATLLLDHGAPANARDDYGKTPLHYAVEKNERLLVELLLAKGADVNAKDNEGDTPLDLAAKRSNVPGPPSGIPFRNGVAPLAYQWTPGGGTSGSDGLSDLLRKHGGVAEVDVATIRVMRSGQIAPEVIFQKDAAGYDRHTLYEFIVMTRGMQFPDFSRLKIIHLPENGRTNTDTVNVSKALTDGDCSKDIPLKWGDIVDVPETDHKVSASYEGLSAEVNQTLQKCLAREVEIKVKGQTTKVRLEPMEGALSGHGTRTQPVRIVRSQLPPVKPAGENGEMQLASFSLESVVHSANVILASSDLSRVKVTRHAAGREREMVFNLEKQQPKSDLLLEDGDVIEIPERSE